MRNIPERNRNEFFSACSGVVLFPKRLENVPLCVDEFTMEYGTIKLANGFKVQNPIELERLFIKMTCHW